MTDAKPAQVAVKPLTRDEKHVGVILSSSSDGEETRVSAKRWDRSHDGLASDWITISVHRGNGWWQDQELRVEDALRFATLIQHKAGAPAPATVEQNLCGRCQKTPGYDCSCEDWQRADHYEGQARQLADELPQWEAKHQESERVTAALSLDLERSGRDFDSAREAVDAANIEIVALRAERDKLSRDLARQVLYTDEQQVRAEKAEAEAAEWKRQALHHNTEHGKRIDELRAVQAELGSLRAKIEAALEKPINGEWFNTTRNGEPLVHKGETEFVRLKEVHRLLDAMKANVRGAMAPDPASATAPTKGKAEKRGNCPDCGHAWQHHRDDLGRCPNNSEVAGIVMRGRGPAIPEGAGGVGRNSGDQT